MPGTSTYHASNGEAYQLFLGRWTTLLAPPLLDFAEFPPDGPLLDVGTGTGSMAFAMAARWPTRQIIAIDIAESYIAFARSKAAAASIGFKVGEATSLQFDDSTFSGATAQLVLNFVPNPSAALNEMK